MKKQVIGIAIICLLIGSLVGIVFWAVTASPNGATYITSGSFGDDYSYLISKKNSTHYQAKNGMTGTVEIESSNASYIFQTVFDVCTNSERVFIQNGTYDLRNVDINGSIQISGEGWGTILRPASTCVNGDWIFRILSDYVTIEDLKFDGNGTDTYAIRHLWADKGDTYHLFLRRLFAINFTSYSAFSIYRHHNVWIEDCFIEYGENGLLDMLYTTDTRIIKSFFYGGNSTQDYLVRIDQGYNVVLDDNLFDTAGVGASDYTLLMQNGARDRVINNHFISGSTAIYLVNQSFTNILINHEEQTVGADCFVNETGTSHSNKIAHNTLISADYIVRTASNTTVFSNIGFVTENEGVNRNLANGDTIAHGLAGTPDYVTLTSLNATYDSESIAVYWDFDNTDSTNISVDIYWTNGTAISDSVIDVSWVAVYEP